MASSVTHLEACRRYREKNRKKVRESSKKYYDANKDKVSAYAKEYYENNKEYVNTRNKKYEEGRKEIRKEQKKIYYQENKDKINARNKKYQEEHEEHLKEKAKEYKSNHPEVVAKAFEKYNKTQKSKDRYKRYAKAHPERVRAKVNKRRAAKLNQLPLWADLEKIKKIYENCPKDMVVDHIIPLQGKNVSGLHIETNLQYLTPEENSKKLNKFSSEEHNKIFGKAYIRKINRVLKRNNAKGDD
jgi:hypothetical protein